MTINLQIVLRVDFYEITNKLYQITIQKSLHHNKTLSQRNGRVMRHFNNVMKNVSAHNSLSIFYIDNR